VKHQSLVAEKQGEDHVRVEMNIFQPQAQKSS